MNSDILAGKWKQLTGKVKAAFGKLTDDDLARAQGNAEVMTGLLQERYGYTKEQASKAWNDFTGTIDDGRRGVVDDAADATERARKEMENRMK
jgi:uncharacterized protein YjbJ (UPF0337 family)